MKTHPKILITVFIFMASANYINAQQDSLVFFNGDIMVGEIKSMERGVLTIETKYSENDFEIEWEEVSEIYTNTYLYYTLANSKHYFGWISTSDSLVNIITRDSIIIETDMDKIVHILSIKKSFKYRFNAEIDVGFMLAKSNDLRQLTAGCKIGYKSENWRTSFSGNILSSIQNYTDPIKRADAEFIFQYIIYNDWYFIPMANFLASTEQQLNSRWNIQLGVGNYILRSNHAYWGVVAGFNRNIEDYFYEIPDRYSWEGYFGTVLNLFDIGDLDLFLKAVTYPSITEAGRWRVDATLNVKYDLPLDFYIKLEFITNYDNKPVEGAGELDYVSTIGFGWEWDVD